MEGGTTARRKIGIIFPDEGAFAYELINDMFINRWLADRGIANVDYMSILTPGGKAATIAACEELAEEDVLAAAARRLGESRCGSVVWACTSASFFKGLDYARQQSHMLSESASVPASSTSMAMLAALQALSARRVDIMMSYMPEVADTMVSFLSQAGIAVSSVHHMVCAPKQRSFDLDYAAELKTLVPTLSTSPDPILIPSTSLNSLDRVEGFEEIAGRPVLTANQVTLWQALVLAGVKQRVEKAGTLFRTPPN